MDKPTVHYRGKAIQYGVGSSALLFTTDHPTLRNHPDYVIRTSKIVAHDEATGRIETKHTIYVPEVVA